MDLTWRPVARADAAALADLLADVEKSDQTGESYVEAELAEELDSTLLDFERGSVAVVAGGQLVGYGLVWMLPNPAQVHRIRIEATVRPGYRGRGVGRELLRRLMRGSIELHGNHHPELPLEVHATAHDNNLDVAAALLGSSDFREARWFFTMRRDLAEPAPDAPVPDGLRLVGYRPDLDEALRLASNEAFIDHWGNVEHSEQSWHEFSTGSRSFLPGQSFALLDERTGEVAAFVLNRFNEGDAEATGVRELWIADLGTRRPWRGRGAATALLAHTLTEARRAGYQRCGLGVDADNPTGALGIYRRAGFEVTDRWTTYVHTVSSLSGSLA